MAELTWKEAVIKVLEEEKKSLHYAEITELVAKRGYRKALGATPQSTVSAQISTDIANNKEKSVFAKVDKGCYILRQFLNGTDIFSTNEPAIKTSRIKVLAEKQEIIKSFGIYWNRNNVYWKTKPDLLGIQQIGATEVNFKDQIGVYLLHDGRETIYAGQAIDQPLGKRLNEHTSDRLSGRWNRFSWFGLYSVCDDGKLNCEIRQYEYLTVKDLGDLLEAVLIESIEPRQNRKQGNSFGNEFLQQEDSEIKKKYKKQIISELIDDKF
jgi:hypothetical protein